MAMIEGAIAIKVARSGELVLECFCKKELPTDLICVTCANVAIMIFTNIIKKEIMNGFSTSGEGNSLRH